MAKSIKTMCEIKQSNLTAFAKDLQEQLEKPKYICSKCIRAAAEKDKLCKPEKLKKLKADD